MKLGDHSMSLLLINCCKIGQDQKLVFTTTCHPKTADDFSQIFLLCRPPSLLLLQTTKLFPPPPNVVLVRLITGLDCRLDPMKAQSV